MCDVTIVGLPGLIYGWPLHTKSMQIKMHNKKSVRCDGHFVTAILNKIYVK